jgi:hypothetical protein
MKIEASPFFFPALEYVPFFEVVQGQAFVWINHDYSSRQGSQPMPMPDPTLPTGEKRSCGSTP